MNLVETIFIKLVNVKWRVYIYTFRIYVYVHIYRPKIM